MFKHILIPTDGSGVAAKAIGAGVRLAAEMGAKITGLYAHEQRPLRLHINGYGVERDLVAELERRAGEFAEERVGEIERAAKAAGVAFEGVVVKAGRPYEAIINAAKERKCDAIFMASHGHNGLNATLLGSVTSQVLAHCTIPVFAAGAQIDHARVADAGVLVRGVDHCTAGGRMLRDAGIERGELRELAHR
jgi:nucleotide-binding universal stress UspA family protein